MAQNVHELADIAALLVHHGVRTWEVFFLIGVGRGETVAEIEPDQYEDVCHFLSRRRPVRDDCAHRRSALLPQGPRLALQALRPGLDPAVEFGLGPLYGELRLRLRELLGEPRSEVLAPTSARGTARASSLWPTTARSTRPGSCPSLSGRCASTRSSSIYREIPRARSDPKRRVPWPLRALRVRQRVRRFKGAGLRDHRGPARRRPGLLVRAPGGDTR